MKGVCRGGDLFFVMVFAIVMAFVTLLLEVPFIIITISISGSATSSRREKFFADAVRPREKKVGKNVTHRFFRSSPGPRAAKSPPRGWALPARRWHHPRSDHHPPHARVLILLGTCILFYFTNIITSMMIL